MGKLQRQIIWAIVFAVLVYAGLTIWSGTDGLWSALGRSSVTVFAAALGLSCVNYAVRWAKWHLYLRALEMEVPVVESIVVFVAGFVMSITPGKVGEVLKSALLKESRGIPVARSAPIVVAERLTDLFGLIVIAAFGIAFFDFGRLALGAVLVGLVAGVLLVQQPAWVARLLDVVERLPLGDRIRPRLDEAYDSTRALLAMRVLVPTIVMSAVGWGMEAFAFYWIVSDLGGEATILLVAFLFATTTILGAVSFLPGGLGVTEGSMIGALMLFGVFAVKGDAAAATYLIRGATLWFGVLLGVIALSVFRLRFAKPSAGTDTSTP